MPSVYSPLPIDNDELVCPHGGLDPRKVKSFKRINSQVWLELHAQFGGGPALTDSDLCLQCAFEVDQIKRAEETYTQQKRKMQDTLHKSRIEPGFWVSRYWMDLWQHLALPGPGDLSPDMTEDITCVHGDLLPNFAGARIIPQSVFRVLSAYFPKGRELAEGSAFPCTICGEEALLAQQGRAERIKLRNEERNRCLELYRRAQSGTQLPYSSGRLSVLPLKWVQQWARYLDDADHLEDLPPIPLSELRCPHGGFLFDPNDKDPESAHWMACEPHTFQILYSKYVADGDPISYVPPPLHGKVKKASSDPATCEICAPERKEQALQRALSYHHGDLWLSRTLKSEHWPLCSSNEQLSRMLDSGNVSSRTRRRSQVERMKLMVNSYDSVYSLKLRIVERVGMATGQQMLYCSLGTMTDSLYDKSDADILAASNQEPSLWAELLTRRLAIARRLLATLPTEPETHLDQFNFGLELREVISKAQDIHAQLQAAITQKPAEPELNALLAAARAVITQDLTFSPDELTLAFWQLRKGQTIRLALNPNPVPATAFPASSASKKVGQIAPTNVAFDHTKLAGDDTPLRIEVPPSSVPSSTESSSS